MLYKKNNKKIVNKLINLHNNIVLLLILFAILLTFTYLSINDVYSQSNDLKKNKSIFVEPSNLNTTYTMISLPYFLNLLNVSSSYPISYMDCGLTLPIPKTIEGKEDVIIGWKIEQTPCNNLLIFQKDPSQPIFDTKLEKEDIERFVDLMVDIYEVYDVIPFQYVLKNLENVLNVASLTCGLTTNNDKWIMTYTDCNSIVMLFTH